jgi:hypothetical protein
MEVNGARVWFIPDAYLAKPASDDPVWKNHEAICVINATDTDARLVMDFYFADTEPLVDVRVTVPARRCLHLRVDDPTQIGGAVIPFDTPYGIRIVSDVPIVVQYSRMYATTHNISLMTTMGYSG